MNAAGVQRITVCSELSVGEEIEAWHRGRLLHRGTVTRIVPSAELFWITDSKNGTRRLVDPEALDILRATDAGLHAGHRAGGTGTVKTRVLTAGGTTDAAAAATQAASCMPLFQEPGVAAPMRC